MNILYLTQFFSSTGGAPLLFYDIAKAMSRRGHCVHILCNLSTETADEENIVVHIVKPYLEGSNQLPPSMIQNLRYIINSVIHGTRIIKKNKIDIVHTNSFAPIIAGSTLRFLTGVPVISAVLDVFTGSESGGWSTWARTNNLSRYHALAGQILERVSLMVKSDVVHTISDTSRQDIISTKSSARIKVIYPGIDLSGYNAQSNKREYGNFILFIGRLVYYKNVDILIKAFKHLKDSYPSAKLVVVGNGPMKQSWQTMALEAGLDDRILFVGNVSNSHKIELLNKCAAVALPSIFEGFGLVILEAFAMAKPVLVANVKPFDEIVDDGIDGFILNRNDPIIWSQKIEYLLMNKSICKKMGENGLPKVNSKFSLTNSIDQIEQLYEETILGEEQRFRKI